MVQHMERNPRGAGTWRLFARLWGTLAAGYWLIAIMAHAFVEPLSEITGEGVVLALLVITATILTAIAWHWEQEGGSLLLLCGVAFSLFALNSAGRNHVFAMLVSGAPFILSGCLFMASAWLNEED